MEIFASITCIFIFLFLFVVFCLLSFAVLSFVFYIYIFGEENTRINSSKHNFNVGPNWYVKTFCEVVFENRLKKQEQGISLKL